MGNSALFVSSVIHTTSKVSEGILKTIGEQTGIEWLDEDGAKELAGHIGFLALFFLPSASPFGFELNPQRILAKRALMSSNVKGFKNVRVVLGKNGKMEVKATDKFGKEQSIGEVHGLLRGVPVDRTLYGPRPAPEARWQHG